MIALAAGPVLRLAFYNLWHWLRPNWKDVWSDVRWSLGTVALLYAYSFTKHFIQRNSLPPIPRALSYRRKRKITKALKANAAKVEDFKPQPTIFIFPYRSEKEDLEFSESLAQGFRFADWRANVIENGFRDNDHSVGVWVGNNLGMSAAITDIVQDALRSAGVKARVVEQGGMPPTQRILYLIVGGQEWS